MSLFRSAAAVLLSGLLALLPAQPASASAQPDGGMWTFDNPPTAILKAKYGFDLTQDWLDKVRLGSVRVSTGGSGSFVSPRGLVMTNHHVALELVGKLSTTDRDLVKDGFLARKEEDEIKCPNADIRHLVSMEDVTAEIEAATKAATSPDEASGMREAAIEAAETKYAEKTGLVVEIVTLYGGGQYMAYGYKVWDDVRLVFAPEMRIAYFGGDYDNFTYPRYCLDAAFLRVYEDGKPADTSAHHFAWNAEGPEAEGLVFVSGHPGDTGRLLPVSTLRFERDVQQPVTLAFLRGREAELAAESAKSEEARLRVLDELFGVRNSIKAYAGQQEGLLDARLMAKKEMEEAELLEKSAADPSVKETFLAIAKADQVRAESFGALVFGRPSASMRGYSRALRDAAKALRIEDAEARPEPYQAANAQASFEKLAKSAEERGAEIARLLHHYATIVPESAPARAKVSEVSGGFDAKGFALALDPKTAAEALSKGGDGLETLAAEFERVGNAVGALEREMVAAAREALPAFQAASAEIEGLMPKIAAARFAAYGKTVPPDATFTLRLTFGRATGYELGTTLVPWKTTMYGLYARNHEFGGAEPFNLPPSWEKGEKALDLSTPFNFVSTCDIIGGNSGSPVLNAKAEVVGLIFDGNIQSLPGRYHFDEKINRALSVHSSGITEALRKIYKASELLAEIGVK